MGEKPGQVVKITNPKHKYYGEEAVIQMANPKTFVLRLLHHKRPFIDRLLFGNDGRVNGTQSDQITFSILKSSTMPIIGRKANPMLNTWQTETSKLLSIYGGKTLTEVIQMNKK